MLDNNKCLLGKQNKANPKGVMVRLANQALVDINEWASKEGNQTIVDLLNDFDDSPSAPDEDPSKGGGDAGEWPSEILPCAERKKMDRVNSLL